MKLNYRRTLLLGFGFLASSLAWSLYNSFVPVMLERRFGLLTSTIGVIMTIDNIFGVIFQPVVGALSDRTFTKLGRRMPWILVGIPTSALFFALIPRMWTFPLMIGTLIAFNLCMSLWRSPVISLMPDLTPPILRNKANALINFMGGIGSIIAFGLGGFLSSQVDAENGLTFLVGSVIMVISLVMLLVYIREPQPNITVENNSGASLGARLSESIKSIFAKDHDNHHLSPAKRRSLFAILLAIFFWFCAYNVIETFFTLFAVKTLGVNHGSATMMLTAFSLSFVVFAIPAGLLGSKLGRKRTILLGLTMLLVFLSPMVFIREIISYLNLMSGLNIKPTLPVILLLTLGGIGWSFININSLPMVVQLSDLESTGRFTGYYYFFSFSASIISPILFGRIRDLTDNYNYLFIYALVAFALALICMLTVKHGEVEKR